MSNTASTTVSEIPAPPPPGAAEALDEMLVSLPAPPQARRRVLGALLSGICAASLFLAWQLKDDALYALSSSTPVSLGDGRTTDPATVGANHYVTLQASPSMARAVTYSRVFFPGQHLVFEVAGRDAQAPLYVQVSQEGTEAMARGEFVGRLIPFGAAGGRYRGVASYLHGEMRAPVSSSTWLVVDGASPRTLTWAPIVASLLVALALSDLLLLGRLLRPTKS